MNKKSRKELAILIALLALLAISFYSQRATDQTGEKILATTVKQSADPAVTAGELLQVRLLDRKVPELSGVKRNIFQFGQGKPVEEDSGEFDLAPEPVTPLVPVVPDIRYLGFYSETETGLQLASVSNSGRIYVGKVGQVLGGRYKVLRIAADHVILQLVQEEGKALRVPLGKRPATFIAWEEQ